MKRVLFSLLVALVSLLLILPVHAVATITAVTFSCSSITVTYETTASNGMDAAQITIYNADTMDVIYDHPPFDPWYDVWAGTYTITFPEQPAGTNLLIEVVAGDPATAKGPCVPAAVTGTTSGSAPQILPGFPDGRFCLLPGIAMYPYRGGLDVYRINDLNRGDLVLRLTPEELADMATMQTPNPDIYSSPDGYINLYRLTELYYQVNVGPDAENKVHVCIFDAIPDSAVFMTSFFLR